MHYYVFVTYILIIFGARHHLPTSLEIEGFPWYSPVFILNHGSLSPMSILYANPQPGAARIFRAWMYVWLGAGSSSLSQAYDVCMYSMWEYPWIGASCFRGAYPRSLRSTWYPVNFEDFHGGANLTNFSYVLIVPAVNSSRASGLPVAYSPTKDWHHGGVSREQLQNQWKRQTTCLVYSTMYDMVESSSLYPLLQW